MSLPPRTRRVLVALLALVALGALAGIAVAVLRASDIDLSGLASEDGSVGVTTELPAATCTKELTGGFPFVRFSCEAKEGGAVEGRAEEAAADEVGTDGIGRSAP